MTLVHVYSGKNMKVGIRVLTSIALVVSAFFTHAAEISVNIPDTLSLQIKEFYVTINSTQDLIDDFKILHTEQACQIRVEKVLPPGWYLICVQALDFNEQHIDKICKQHTE